VLQLRIFAVIVVNILYTQIIKAPDQTSNAWHIICHISFGAEINGHVNCIVSFTHGLYVARHMYIQKYIIFTQSKALGHKNPNLLWLWPYIWISKSDIARFYIILWQHSCQLIIFLWPYLSSDNFTFPILSLYLSSLHIKYIYIMCLYLVFLFIYVFNMPNMVNTGYFQLLLS
jgi:hypothetical protein